MENNKKKKDGKIKRFLKGAAVVALISPLLTSGCTYTVMKSDTDSYSDQKQIEHMAGEIGCDLSVMKFLSKKNNHVKRLRHNEGEPIYISFDDGYNEKYKQVAKDSIEYVFSIVGSINDDYKKYEYVDQSEVSELENSGRTVIEYKNEGNFQASTISGQMVSNHIGGLNHLLANKQVICDPEIQMNFERLKDYDEKFTYTTYVHELLHGFGFGDVYNTKQDFETDKFYGNTIMHVGAKTGIITPNDYACLLSSYAKPMNNDELFHYTEKCKQKLEEYKKYYSQALEAEVSEMMSGYLDDKIDFEGEKNVSKFEREYFYDENTSVIEKYVVAINGDEYSFIITDKDNKVLDTAKGKATLVNGAYVLNDVELKENIRPLVDSKKYEGYITNLVIYRTPERDYMFNTADSDIFWGMDDQIQMNR